MTGDRILKINGRKIVLPKNIDENDKRAKRDGIVFPDLFFNAKRIFLTESKKVK